MNQTAADKDALRDASLDTSGIGVTETGRTEEQQAIVASSQHQTLRMDLMEAVVEKANLNKAYQRVVSNKGAPGIDGMSTQDLKQWFEEHGETLIEALLQGTYEPMPVKGVFIPKPNGGTRKLGIPTVVDRSIQQAILQVLTPIIDPTFSESSYGFRPQRSAHQALLKAKEYVAEGREIVVDIDLEKFFDKVNHDILMSRVARHIKDKRLLKLIRMYLQAGVLESGVRVRSEEGTPQGGPLSPLLANIMLDDLDKELERRGHKFCRYADDCNIYVKSIAAGQRVMASVTEFLTKRLRLTVNQEKSTVAPSRHPNILGIPANELWELNHSTKKSAETKRYNKNNNEAEPRM
jgi:RNA-directed DNA polymerase